MVGRTYEPIYYTDNEAVEIIKEYHRVVTKLQQLAQDWADDPESLYGVTLLEQISRETDFLWSLADHESVHYKETERITNLFRLFSAMLQRVRNNSEMNLTFSSGREVQRLLDEIDEVVEERKKIMEYATE